GRRTAVGILVVDQSVAVVVEAIAAHLDRAAAGEVGAVAVAAVDEAVAVVVDAVVTGLGRIRRATRERAHDAGARQAGVDRAGVGVVTVRVDDAAARTRGRHGAYTGDAALGRAGVAVVRTVGVDRARRAPGVRGRGTGTGDAGVRGAGVRVVAIAVARAGGAATGSEVHTEDRVVAH